MNTLPDLPRCWSAWFALLGLLCLSTSSLASSTSSSFVLSQSTVGGGGGQAVSSSFVLDGTLSQPTPVGQAGSASFVVQSGFWTSLSTRILLRVGAEGSGRGSITGGGISCFADGSVISGDCLESVSYGTTLALVATPDAANQFDGWTGCDRISTTTSTHDTCQLTLRRDREVTAGFTLLGTIGGQLWRDVNGNGAQDPSEPSLAGVAVAISNGGAWSVSATTNGAGFYQFIDAPPDTYELTVDPLTLPPGVVPSYDFDGTGTANTATVSIVDGEMQGAVDFGYQPFVDLVVSLTDSADPLPGGDHLVYTVEVLNRGPSYATKVALTDVLPEPATRLATEGCAEDPAGTPTCSLGTLMAGESAVVTIEVAIDPAPPSSMTNIVSVTSAEGDLQAVDNVAEETTDLDDGPPEVFSLATDPVCPGDADGLLGSCESVFGVSVDALRVTFDEPLFDPPGDDTPGDVTNSESWSLVAEGEDLSLDTFGCDTLEGDDQRVGLDSVSWDGIAVARLTLESPLQAGRYRLLACGDGTSYLRDRAGNALDGDSDLMPGGNFTIDFRADPDNLFNNGHFDCGLESWDLDRTSTPEIYQDPNDVDDSPQSGSAGITNLTGSTYFAVSQCAAITQPGPYRFTTRLRLDAPESLVAHTLVCSDFEASDCSGAALGEPTISWVYGGGLKWGSLSVPLTVSRAASSVLCSVEIQAAAPQDFTSWLDQVTLRIEEVLFADGFESGDTSAWQ